MTAYSRVNLIECQQEMDIKFLLGILLLILLFGLGNASAAAEPETKASIPDAASQDEAKLLVARVYHDDYLKADTPERKIQLAKKLIGVARRTNGDLAGRYVLLKIGHDVALQVGDIKTAYDSVNQLAADFEVDGLEVKMKLAEKMIRSDINPYNSQDFLSVVVELIDDAVRVNRFEIANSAHSVAKAIVRDEGNFQRIRIANIGDDLEVIENAYSVVRPALERLRADPEDLYARTQYGRFLCFVKSEWREGLALLASGEDQTLRELAQLEVGPDHDLLKAADKWLSYAERYSGRPKKLIILHALECYEEVYPELVGPTRKRVESLLSRMDPKTRRLPPSNLPTRSRSMPAKSSSNRTESEWQDLLAKIDHPTGQSLDEMIEVGGKTSWQRIDTGIATSKTGKTRIGFPTVLPDEYDLAIDMTMNDDGGKRVRLFLPFGENRVMLQIFRKPDVTYFALDGGLGLEDPRVSAKLPPVEGPLRIQLSVKSRDARFIIAIKDQPIISIADLKALRKHSSSTFAADTNCAMIIHSLRWRGLIQNERQ